MTDEELERLAQKAAEITARRLKAEGVYSLTLEQAKEIYERAKGRSVDPPSMAGKFVTLHERLDILQRQIDELKAWRDALEEGIRKDLADKDNSA